MTREEYLKVKESRTIDINSAYEFYVNADSTQDKLDFQQFQYFFPIYLASAGTMDLYFGYFDRKFNILKLVDSKGNLKQY